MPLDQLTRMGTNTELCKIRIMNIEAKYVMSEPVFLNEPNKNENWYDSGHE